MESEFQLILIFGGIDNEHNISLSTLRSFLDHSTYSINAEVFYLNTNGYFYPVPLQYVYANNYQDFYDHIINQDFFLMDEFIGYLTHRKNILVWNFIHGLLGDDGQLNNMINNNHIPHIGSHGNLFCTFNKFLFNEWAHDHGLKNIKY